MELVGWQTIYRAPKISIAAVGNEFYPYLLKGLSIRHRNQVWTTDITYIPMAKGIVYLMAVIDVYTRYVVHWSLSNTMPAEWCADTLKEALAKGEKPLIMNTDQGSQFTSKVFIDVLKESGIQISMDGKGRAIDNIFIERFWRSVKYEQVYLQVPENATVIYQDLENYIAFYNDKRLHQSLNYATTLLDIGWQRKRKVRASNCYRREGWLPLLFKELFRRPSYYLYSLIQHTKHSLTAYYET